MFKISETTDQEILIIHWIQEKLVREKSKLLKQITTDIF